MKQKHFKQFIKAIREWRAYERSATKASRALPSALHEEQACAHVMIGSEKSSVMYFATLDSHQESTPSQTLEEHI